MAHYSDLRRQYRDSLQGKEIVEITPIILGGSPTDPSNKAAVSRQQHIEAARYWNKIITDLRNQRK
jgi:hypothetical protein